MDVTIWMVPATTSDIVKAEITGRIWVMRKWMAATRIVEEPDKRIELADGCVEEAMMTIDIYSTCTAKKLHRNPVAGPECRLEMHPNLLTTQQ